MLELPVESEIWEPIAEVQEEPQQVSSTRLLVCNYHLSHLFTIFLGPLENRMVRGLKAKDLLKDDKVTLSTKWREKSLGNNPFECWRLGGT